MAPILHDLGMPPEEVATIIGAIGNHEETHGHPVNHVSAALILADKVTSTAPACAIEIWPRSTFMIGSITRWCGLFQCRRTARTITLDLTIEREVTSVLEYFEIFLDRMVMSRRAAEYLDCRFHLVINGATLL